jgi:hypothetical protein
LFKTNFCSFSGFNAGEFFEEYLSHLHPENPLMIQNPRKLCGTFDLKEKCNTILFGKASKVGTKKIQDFMPMVN